MRLAWQDGSSLLHNAAAYGRLDVVRYLALERKHDLAAKNKVREQLKAVLSFAAMQQLFLPVHELVCSVCGLERAWPPIQLGTFSRGSCLVVPHAKCAWPDSELRCCSPALQAGRTPLVMAIGRGHYEAARSLILEAKSPLDLSDEV